MPRLVRLAVSLLALVVALAGLTACGSATNDSGSSDARAELRQAFGSGHDLRSGRLDLTLHADVKGLPSLTQPLDLELSGPFQSNGPTTLPNFDFELALGGGAKPVTLGMTSTGKAGFLALEGQAYDLGAEAYASLQKGYADSQRKSQAQQKNTPSLATLGVHPDRWVRDPRRAGSEDIAGTTTDHLVADVDADALLADVNTLLSKSGAVAGATGRNLPRKLTDAQRKALVRSIKDATVDVWVGKGDHTLRKFALNVTLDAPQDVRDQLGGLRSGTISFGATLADLNQPQKITAPAGAKPLSELQSALAASGLLKQGSRSSSGSSSSSGSGSSTPGLTGAQAKYAQCLQDAGNDLRKVQLCASILEK